MTPNTMDKSGSERSYEKRNGDGAEFYAAGGVLHDRRPADQFLFCGTGRVRFRGNESAQLFDGRGSGDSRSGAAVWDTALSVGIKI